MPAWRETKTFGCLFTASSPIQKYSENRACHGCFTWRSIVSGVRLIVRMRIQDITEGSWLKGITAGHHSSAGFMLSTEVVSVCSVIVVCCVCVCFACVCSFVCVCAALRVCLGMCMCVCCVPLERPSLLALGFSCCSQVPK